MPPSGVAVYEQDFESLGLTDPAALSGDGWFYFGVVFDGTQSPPAFKFDFGPFPAPNGPQTVAVADGEGGTEQGAQQLNMYSNYECCDPAQGHRNGTDLVESIVFQELTVAAEDVGKTFAFSFDAKRGNINDPANDNCINTVNPPCDSTANAFIKTIDPNNNFARTNLVEEDTTNLLVDWERKTVSLNLTDPALEGQTLQFGFQTVANAFEPSANFYDNVVATKSPTAP